MISVTVLNEKSALQDELKMVLMFTLSNVNLLRVAEQSGDGFNVHRCVLRVAQMHVACCRTKWRRL